MYLSEFANEGSTFVVNVVLDDENGSVITPASMTWGLFDNEGNVINSRSSVAVSTPGLSTDIVLSGDDLSLNGSTSLRVERVLRVNATYNPADSSLGTGLPIKQEFHFFVHNLIGS
tara:strand:- start:1007 stop:1354 length:348 start_codon:yes stop_codon:yes gene_type:complete